MMIGELSEYILKLSVKNITNLVLWRLNTVETIGDMQNELFVNDLCDLNGICLLFKHFIVYPFFYRLLLSFLFFFDRLLFRSPLSEYAFLLFTSSIPSQAP